MIDQRTDEELQRIAGDRYLSAKTRAAAKAELDRRQHLLGERPVTKEEEAFNGVCDEIRALMKEEPEAAARRLNELAAMHRTAINRRLAADIVVLSCTQKLDWARERMRQFGQQVSEFCEGAVIE